MMFILWDSWLWSCCWAGPLHFSSHQNIVETSSQSGTLSLSLSLRDAVPFGNHIFKSNSFGHDYQTVKYFGNFLRLDLHKRPLSTFFPQRASWNGFPPPAVRFRALGSTSEPALFRTCAFFAPQEATQGRKSVQTQKKSQWGRFLLQTSCMLSDSPSSSLNFWCMSWRRWTWRVLSHFLHQPPCLRSWEGSSSDTTKASSWSLLGRCAHLTHLSHTSMHKRRQREKEIENSSHPQCTWSSKTTTEV